MKYTFADLFCGCGGLSHGFHKNRSFSCIRALDSWQAAVDTYNSNNKSKVAVARDLYDQKMIDLTVSELADKTDILLGGPPCQGFSTLGKRRQNCEKSVLVDIYLKIATRVRPRILIMENVRGISSKKHPNGGTYPEHIDELLSPQFNYSTFLISTLDYGLAQTRTRFILVATLKSNDPTGNLLNQILTNIANRKTKKKPTLSDVIGDLPPLGEGIGADCIETSSGNKIFNHRSLKHSEKLRKRFSHVPPGGGLLDVPEEMLTPHLRRMVQGKYGSGGHVKNIYGRLDWDKPCGTIVAGIDKITCGRYVHPEDNRLLTPRECARIQSYPDDFVFSGSNVTQYYLIGNSVPPKISEVICRSIVSSLDSFVIKRICA